MGWVRAKLRDQVVLARVNEDGSFREEGGTVEVRYKANDGRLYRARAANLTVVDAAVLPDDTCGDAQAVSKPSPAAKKATAAAAATAASVSTPDDAVVAYTDGACSGNPGPAGVGMVLIDGKERRELSEYLGSATNNVAELTAILRALEGVADRARPIVVHTDSQYAIGVLSKGWKAKANVELIRQIKAELASHPRVKLVYVPGHAGVPLNERADALARQAVERRKTQSTSSSGG